MSSGLRISSVCTSFVLALSLLVIAAAPAYSQTAVVFGEEGAYLEVPNDTSLVTPEFTIEFWVQVRDFGESGSKQTIMDLSGGGSSGYSISIEPNGLGEHGDLSGSLSFCNGCLSPGVPPTVLLQADSIDQLEWAHFAIVQGANSATIYLNGEPVAVDAVAPAGNQRSVNPLRIGEALSYPFDTTRFRGALDELRIWDHERPADSIRAHVHVPVSPAVPGLRLCYNFEELHGDALPDLSSYGNDAIVHGSAHLEESTAPVDHASLPTPYGLRAFGEEGQIALIWKSYGPPVASYQVYRGDSANFVPDASTAIAEVRAPDTTYIDDEVVDGRFYFYRLRTKDVDGHKSASDHVAASRTTVLKDAYLTGAFYYGYFGESYWSHPLRPYLVPPQPPELGEYSSGDPEVVRQHLAWMEEYGIDFILPLETQIPANDMLDELANSPIKFAMTADDGCSAGEDIRNRLLKQFTYLADHVLSHPNYLDIGGRKVVFLRACSGLTEAFIEACQAVRDSMSTLGYGLYLVGDDDNLEEPRDAPWGVFDAVRQNDFHVTRSNSGYAVTSDYLAHTSTLSEWWQELAFQNGIAYVPTVFPGKNPYGPHHRASTGPDPVTPPQFQPGDKDTSFLDQDIRTVRPFVDPTTRMILIDSWNGWQSDTQIEPSVITEPTSVDSSPEGNGYTQGYTYTGYGMDRLAVVRNLLAPELPVGTEPDDLPENAGVTIQTYPNPFQDRVRIDINVPNRALVKVTLYDVLGRQVSLLENATAGPGTEHLSWDGENLASGLYFVRITAGDKVETVPILKVASRP